jgi:hypothetical protein
MKICNFKIIVAILAFLLGIFSVWFIGGFSYLTSLFERDTVISEVSAQTNEVSPKAIPNKNETRDIPKLTYPFKDYSITEIYKGKVAPLRLTRKEKESDFGEKLQYTIDNFPEVNFAGHYIAATWGCGMWCHWSAIIDAKTGKIYSWSGMNSYCFPRLDKDFACNENFSDVEYRIDSKLIVFFGYKNGEAGSRGFHYYKFENGRFIHLKSVLVKEQRSTSEIMLDKANKKTNDDEHLEK